MGICLDSGYLWLNNQKFKILDMNEDVKTITIDANGKSDLFCNEEDKYSFLKYTGPGYRITLEDFMNQYVIRGVKLLGKNEKEVHLGYQACNCLGSLDNIFDEHIYDLHYSSHPLKH